MNSFLELKSEKILAKDVVPDLGRANTVKVIAKNLRRRIKFQRKTWLNKRSQDIVRRSRKKMPE